MPQTAGRRRPAKSAGEAASALVAADVKDFTFHDCRHTAAAQWAMSGASLRELAAMLGHKTLAMVLRYAHLTEDHIVEVAERATARFLPGAG